MSNRIVPDVYRGIVHKTIEKCKVQWDAQGLDPRILEDIEHQWLRKVEESGVAEFHEAAVAGPGTAGGVGIGIGGAGPGMSGMLDASRGGRKRAGVVSDGKPEGGPRLAPPFAPMQFPLPAGPHMQMYSQQQQQQQQRQQQQFYMQNGANMFPHFLQQQQAQAHAMAQAQQAHAQAQAQVQAQTHTQSQKAKNQRLPQVDGPSDVPTMQSTLDRDLYRRLNGDIVELGDVTIEGNVTQVDGANDELDELDDPSLDDVELDEDEDLNTNNVLICQYEKVTRAKQKWKCVFKDGIISVDGKDYLFHKAQGEFEWK